MAKRARIRVLFEDGHTEEFNPNKPRFLLDMEKRFGVQSPERHEHVAWLAHRAIGDGKPFDEFVDSIEEFDTINFDDEDEGEGGKEPDQS